VCRRSGQNFLMAFFQTLYESMPKRLEKLSGTREATQSTDQPLGWGACRWYLFLTSAPTQLHGFYTMAMTTA
jgi:hypothetical protein